MIRWRSVLVSWLLVCAPHAARAADTIETWDVGAADVEFHTGVDGLGSPPGERVGSVDFVLGYGTGRRVSVYLSGGLAVDEGFATRAGLALGMFGTPLDTDHVDVDVLLELGGSGDGLRELVVTPAVELNLDAAPDRASFGGYVRVATPVPARANAAATHPAALDLTVGLYAMAAERHQLLLELSLAVRPFASGSEPDVDGAGIALGYNVQLSDAIELVSELSVAPPVGESRAAVGASVGFIATLSGAPP